MTRNYLVTLSPITFRALLQAQIATGLAPSPAMIATLLWLSWLLPLLIHEVACRLVGLPRRVRTRRVRMGAPGLPHAGAGSA